MHRLIPLFIFCTVLASAQAQTDSLSTSATDTTTTSSGRASLSISVGNNGQVERILSDHYTPYYSMGVFIPESKRHTNSSDFKFNLSAELLNARNSFIRLKAGYNQRKYNATSEDRTNKYTLKSKQNVTNFNIAFGRSFELNRFTINTGLELPIFFVGNYTTEEKHEYFRTGQSSPDDITIVKIDQEGGVILGLNTFLHCKYFLSKKFFATTEISFGLLHTETGENKVIEEEYVNAAIALDKITYTVTNDLKKTYFSPPELALGIGYKF